MKLAWLLALLLVLLACRSGAASGEQRGITVLAAASLTDAFTEVASAFETRQPGVSVGLSFAGTALLRIQLEQGAMADVFASADRRQMALAQSGQMIAGEPQVFAASELALIARKDGPIRELLDLAQPGVRLVVALPEVPAGAYAEQLFAMLSAAPEYGPDFVQAVRGNIVSLEGNVRLVVGKVLLGEVDAGFVYRTDAQAGSGVQVLPIAESYRVEAEYLIATTRHARAPDLADAFIQFLLSTEGQSILARYGFGGPPT